MCGAEYKRVELMFDAGSVEPVAGEILTGGSSGHYGTVVSVELESGSWAGANADGRVEMSNASGVSEDDYCFTDNENITGSAGAALVADQRGWEQTYGILHPENEMRKATDNYWYCIPHYALRWGSAGADEAKIDISERGRYEP